MLNASMIFQFLAERNMGDMKLVVKLGLLSAMLSLAWPAQALIFGENTAGSSSISYGDHGPATQFTCNETGTVNYILLYVSSLNGGETGRAAIYNSRDDGSGRETPNVLLRQSASQALVLGWNTFPISGTSVSNGAVYWLCLIASADTVSIAGYTDSFGKSRYSDLVITSFPNPYPDASAASFRISIFATDVVPSPTPTVTPTFTPTASSTPTPSATVSATATNSATSTPTGTHTGTTTPTATISATSTDTPVVTPTRTPVVNPASTATPVPGSATPGDLHGRVVWPYPNPAKDRVNFLFQLERPADIQIIIYTINAEIVAEINRSLGAGQGTVEWRCGQCAPGIYLARVFINREENGTVKLAIRN